MDFSDIEAVIRDLNMPENVKADALSVYKIILEAESRVHNCEIKLVHFHEVGAIDAIADVCNVCFLMNELKADHVYASPINLGSGSVKCAHGMLPVPAPAVAEIIKGIPSYQSDVKAELCTPTGAALLSYFVDEFCLMPPISVTKIGIGAGCKDLPEANILRAFLGEKADDSDFIAVLECQMDDMTGEDIGFATETLLGMGALDVYTTPISMKKNRPGILLTVICSLPEKSRMIELLFKHTTTLGIRENVLKRSVLDRKKEFVDTAYGSVSKKISSGFDIIKEKYEYEDLAKIARDNDMSIVQVRKNLSGK